MLADTSLGLWCVMHDKNDISKFYYNNISTASLNKFDLWPGGFTFVKNQTIQSNNKSKPLW